MAPLSQPSPSAATQSAASQSSPAPALVSVILPIYDRAAQLRLCMECLAKQSRGLSDVEIWIIGDGSPNLKELENAAREPLAGTGARLNFTPRPKLGPAIQRNWAMRQATGEILLFLNDDVEFGPDFVEAHLAAHRAQPGHAVCGNMRWKTGEREPSAFMQWIAHSTPLYYLFQDTSDIGWEFIHTLNFSIHRKWIEGGANDFREEFPDPAFEDTEWGLRLHQQGLRVAFAPHAVLYHRHAYSEEGYWPKSRMKSSSAKLFLKIHPQMRERILGPSQSWLQRFAIGARTILAGLRGEHRGPREWEAKESSIFRSR